MLGSLAREHVADAGEVPSGGRGAVDRGDDVAFLKSGRGGRGVVPHRADGEVVQIGASGDDGHSERLALLERTRRRGLRLKDHDAAVVVEDDVGESREKRLADVS